jgi:hypothetical protein
MHKLGLFHLKLIGSDPTPEQLQLYEASATKHGFANEKPDRDRFVATFVLGLHLTFDPDSGRSRSVPFAVPQALDQWVIDAINDLLVKIKAQRKDIPKEERIRGNKRIAEAITCLEIGSRVFSVASEPSRWVAFGFTRDMYAPPWLKDGLL